MARFKAKTTRELGSMIVGDTHGFRYRSSYFINEVMEDVGVEHRHTHSSTRRIWADETVQQIIEEEGSAPGQLPPSLAAILRYILALDERDERDEGADDGVRSIAIGKVNDSLRREGFQAFRDPDGLIYFKHLPTQTLSERPDPHKAFSAAEAKRREQLSEYLDRCSEDELIEQVLLPLYRQLGYHRITPSGHEDKNLEHGKDVWMRYQLPSQHMLYFGLQVKKGKLDASADSTKRDGPNTNVAIIHNQLLMMLDSPIWDPEFNSKRLVDHAFIVAGGKITKSAQAWLAHNLSSGQRSRIMFMDRDDILNLFISSNTQLPVGALPPAPSHDGGFGGFADELDDDVPF